MANYNVDIGVKVRGEELKKFAEQLKQTKKQVDGVNKFLDTFRKQNIRVNESITNLNAQLSTARTTFQNATIGTKQQIQAAKDLLIANENLNKGLTQQQQLLDNLSGATAKKTAADNQELQNALLKLERQSNKELEEKFETRQKFQNEFKNELNDVNQQRQQENKLLKENVEKTKQNVAAEIKKKFSIVASAKQRRADLIQANRQVQTEIRINKILEARRTTQAGIAGNRQAGKTVGSTASSAIIGGAFPLLFGQTGAAAVGGGIGGAAGGLIGGQFGFALSILGTAIGSFIQQQDELDKSLSKISRSFENAGSSAGFTRESFNELKSTLRMTKDEVLAVATEFARFGEAGESAAFIFGDNPNTFKNLAAIRDTNTLMTAILDTQNGLSIKQQIQLLREAKVTSFKDMQLKLNRMILEENMRREIIEARQITRQEKISDVFKEQLRLIMLIKSFGTMDLEKGFPEFFKKSSEKAEENVEKIKAEFEELMVELPELQDLLTELDTQVQGMGVSIPSAIDSVSAELKKLNSVAFVVTNVADTVGSAFGESFKGIVKGSMTAQDALRNLFQRTADAFLDMAAQLIAKQIQMKILGIGLNFFGGGTDFGTGIPSGANLLPGSFGTGTAGGVGATANDLTRHLANGGTAQRGKSYLVGERGAEIFTPGVTGTVTPNHAMGGTNIVVNVDASGSNVEGDEEEGRALGLALSAAIETELIKQKRPGGLLA